MSDKPTSRPFVAGKVLRHIILAAVLSQGVANAALTLTVNSLTADELSLTIGGVLDSDVVGDQRGWLAIKNSWSTNVGNPTEFFSYVPVVTLNTISIGGMLVSGTEIQNGTSPWQDSILFPNPNGGQFATILAGTVVAGSLVLSGVGAFDPSASLELVSGFNNVNQDWVRLEAFATSPVPEPAALPLVLFGTLAVAALSFFRRRASQQ